jgi:hypothetical protein
LSFDHLFTKPTLDATGAEFAQAIVAIGAVAAYTGGAGFANGAVQTVIARAAVRGVILNTRTASIAGVRGGAVGVARIAAQCARRQIIHDAVACHVAPILGAAPRRSITAKRSFVFVVVKAQTGAVTGVLGVALINGRIPAVYTFRHVVALRVAAVSVRRVELL